MNNTEYIVYWTMSNGHPASAKHTELTAALRHAELHRRQGMQFVTLCSQDVNRVGKDGVDEIKDGKTPDGIEYSWNKDDRIGAVRK